MALKRFYLGYPPRKKEDNSIGDAINWEWIINCASRTDKDIILVTRDNDFGVTIGDKSYLNDWLKIEFKERISQRRKIILTDKLSKAFKLVHIPVTEEMIEEENSIIETRKFEDSDFRKNIDINKLRLKLRELYGDFKTKDEGKE